MIHKINNNKVYISVDTMGAELRSLCDVHGLEYLWQGGEKWNQQSPVIFPIVGKPKDFKYIYGGKEYEIANHGFAMTKEFKVAQKRSDKLVLRLREDEETYKSYPFMFTLDMCFELHDDSLTVRFIVTNNDEKDMPYSLGGHPGFRVPLESDEKFEDYYLLFDHIENCPAPYLTRFMTAEPTEFIPVLENTDRWNLKHENFHRGVLVLEHLKSRGVKLLSSVSGRGLRMDFEDFDNLALWQQSDADYICLEPWTSPGSFSDPSGLIVKRKGMRILKPHETVDYKYTVTLL